MNMVFGLEKRALPPLDPPMMLRISENDALG